MKVRGLLIAVLALVVLGGVAFWANKKDEAAAKKGPAENPETPKILAIPESDLTQVKIEKTGGETTVLKKEGTKWTIAEPKPLPADTDAANGVTGAFSALTADRVIEEKPTDLSPFGLDKPSLQVVLTKKDGKTSTLYLGNDTPTGGGAYAKVDNDPRVFTVGSFVKSSVDKTSKDLRDKRLLTFDSDKLTRVTLQAKGPEVEFGKNGQSEWQILKPKPLRADNAQVEEIVRKIKDAKMENTEPSTASATKIATATATDASGTQTLEVRRDKDKNCYARSSVVEGVYKVANDLCDGLEKSADDFRNKKVFDFGWNDPTKVEINGKTYQKSGENWTEGTRKLDASSVQNVIDKLRDLAATKFADSAGGAQTMQIIVTAKSTERVTILKQGDKYFAKRENEPGAYELDVSAVEGLQKAVGEIKDFQPPKK